MKAALAVALLALLGCSSSGAKPHDAGPLDSSSDNGGSDGPDDVLVSDAIDRPEAELEAPSEPDGALEHADSVEAGLDARDDARVDSACAAGCSSTTTGTFCNAGEVQWTCTSGNFNPTSFNAYCRDAGTNAIRYCCPASFVPLCD
jgi:hypothetical protein